MRYYEIIRESYETIFNSIQKGIEQKYPNSPENIQSAKKIFDKEANWAKENLVRKDRIEWYLHNIEPMLIYFSNETNIDPLDVYLNNAFKHKLRHFLSLPIKKIQDTVFSLNDNDILNKFSEYEAEYYAEKRGDLRHLYGKTPDPIKMDHWPLSDSELRDLERTLMQEPLWLAYWEKRGWTNWNEIKSQKYFDKSKNTFSVYDVPAIWYDPQSKTIKPYDTMVKIDLKNGEMLSGTSDYADLNVPLPRAVELIKRYTKNFSGDNLKYLTGRYYVRFGKWREDERSQNFLASTKDNPVWEKGVSAYHADWDVDEQRWDIGDGINPDTITGTLESLYTSNREIFLIQGTELPEDGADDEPLLKNVKLVKKIKITDINVPGIFDPREDL